MRDHFEILEYRSSVVAQNDLLLLQELLVPDGIFSLQKFRRVSHGSNSKKQNDKRLRAFPKRKGLCLH
jgi:hypothetical protein